MSVSVVKSAGRVFEVFELFDAERRAMSATHIARALKYPASSTVALLKSMVSVGYLAYEAHERTYFPTVQLAAIGRWVEDSFFVDGHVLELMDAVAEATGENVMLSWQTELSMQFICAKSGGRHAPRMELGPRLPLFTSIPGLTALTLKRDVEIALLAERCNRTREAGEPRVDLPAAMERIRNFRALGYGVGAEACQRDFGSIAWALRHRRNQRCVVISIFGPALHIQAQAKAIILAARPILKRFAVQ